MKLGRVILWTFKLVGKFFLMIFMAGFSIAAVIAPEILIDDILFTKKIGYENALMIANCMVQWEPTRTDLYLKRGILFECVGEKDKAVQDYDTAYQLAPERYRHYKGFSANHDEVEAEMSLLMGSYENAVVEYSKLLKKYSNNVQFYVNRASAYCRLNEQNNAIKDYNTALKLDPEAKYILSQRAYAYLSLNRFEEAINDAMEILSSPDSRNLPYRIELGNMLLGDIYFKMQDYEKAVKFFSKTIDSIYKSTESYFISRKEEYNEMDIRDMIYYFLDMDNQFIDTYFYKARALDELGRKNEAIDAYYEFLKFCPMQVESHIDIAKERIKALEKL